MKKFFAIALGILSAIGGFVDIGDLVFNMGAGATFGYALLLWILRQRPFAFGALLGFGTLHREFTFLALPALAVACWRDPAYRTIRSLAGRGPRR